MQSSYKYCTRNRTQKTWIWDFTQFLSNCSAKSLQSCPTLYNPMGYPPPSSSVHGDSPGKNTEVSCPAHPPPGISPTQGSNPRLLHWQVGSLPLAPPGEPQVTVRIWANQWPSLDLSFLIHEQRKRLRIPIVCLCALIRINMWDIQIYTERYRNKHTHIWGLHKKNCNYVRDLLMFSRCLLTPAE